MKQPFELFGLRPWRKLTFTSPKIRQSKKCLRSLILLTTIHPPKRGNVVRPAFHFLTKIVLSNTVVCLPLHIFVKGRRRSRQWLRQTWNVWAKVIAVREPTGPLVCESNFRNLSSWLPQPILVSGSLCSSVASHVRNHSWWSFQRYPHNQFRLCPLHPPPKLPPVDNLKLDFGIVAIQFNREVTWKYLVKIWEI